MKTPPMAHQEEALDKMAKRVYFALFCEQGTGKTWMLLADAERLYMQKLIESMIVVAPKGVHTNWVLREIPQHLEVGHHSYAYLTNRKATNKKECRKMLDSKALSILSINIDALNTPLGYSTVKRMLQAKKTLLVMDESSRIKDPSAKRTKNALKLSELAVARRIASGTPLTKSPPDLWSQFEFLRHGLLRSKTYHSFVAQYAQLLPAEHHLMRHIARRSRHAPQIIARDEHNRPKWRNLDQLQQIAAPHCYRITKDKCLDLPPKIYQVRDFTLTPEQRRVYQLAWDDLILQIGDRVDQLTALTKMVKAQQVTSGFVLVDGEPVRLMEENPRIQLLADTVDDIEGSFIVWARFREELKAIASVLKSKGISAREYHGGVSTGTREQAVDDFQAHRVRAFVGQPQTGGVGLTLTAAQTVIYFSNDFKYENRKQSEDRCHRKGTKHKVVYIDFIANNTIDELIVQSLKDKEDVAAQVLGDKAIALRYRSAY